MFVFRVFFSILLFRVTNSANCDSRTTRYDFTTRITITASSGVNFETTVSNKVMNDFPEVCEFSMNDLDWDRVKGSTWDGVAVILVRTNDHSIFPLTSLSNIFSVDKISVYKINSFTLQDLDECSDSNECGNGTTCINTEGSYNCSCKELEDFEPYETNVYGHVACGRPNCSSLQSIYNYKLSLKGDDPDQILDLLEDHLYGEYIFVCDINFSDVNWESKNGGKFEGTGKIYLNVTSKYILSIEEMEDATDINKLGSFNQFSAEFTDYDECSDMDPCGNFTVCTNIEGSHYCDCLEGSNYFVAERDDFGTLHCDRVATTECGKSGAYLSVSLAFLNDTFIDPSTLHLNDENCTSVVNSQFVFFNLSSVTDCSSEITVDNATIRLYSNIVTNIPTTSDTISAGYYVSITFTCKYTKASDVYSPEYPYVNLTKLNDSTMATTIDETTMVVDETTELTTSATSASDSSPEISTTGQSQVIYETIELTTSATSTSDSFPDISTTGVNEILTFKTTSTSNMSVEYEEIVTMDLSVTLDREFNEDLEDTSSIEFKDLSLAIISDIKPSFNRKGFINITLSKFRKGSVVCDLSVTFGATEQQVTEESFRVRDSLLEGFSSFHSKFLRSGKVGGYAVRQESIQYAIREDNVICGPEKFACKNAHGTNISCIPASWKCDKLADCPDGDDEFNCASIQSLDFTNIETNCGGDIALGSNKSIAFAHPDWPSHYTADRLCTWHITADVNKWISLWFHAFNVEMGYSCEFDHLRFSISPNSTKSSLKYCGILGKNNGPPFQMVIFRNDIYLTFQSDNLTQLCGFLLTSRPKTANLVAITQGCTQYLCKSAEMRICVPFSWLCDGEEDCPYGEDESNCTHIMDHPVPAISQCYSVAPSNNKEGSQCIIETHCSRAYSSKICHAWSNCHSHNGTFIPNCRGPDVESQFQDQIKTHIKEFQCDDRYSIPLSWVCDKLVDCPKAEDELDCKTYSNTISQLLRTGEDKTNIVKSCGGHLYGNHMSMFSHSDYPNPYANSISCTWLLTTDSDRVVRLYFIRFVLPSARGCLSDLLAIYDGPNATYPSLGWHCRTPNHIPVYITSTKNEMLILLKSDCSQPGQLLMAYKGIPQPYNHKEIRVFHHDCYVNGFSYRGPVNFTSSGKTCQRWIKQFPWSHNEIPEKVPGAGLEDNYCRYPIEDWRGPFKTPVCFTTDRDVAFETCDNIPRCSFTGCPKYGTYYQCSSGECIPLNWRCDFIPDCPLADDEFNCSEEIWREKEIISSDTEACGTNLSPLEITRTKGYLGLSSNFTRLTSHSFFCSWRISPKIGNEFNSSENLHLILIINELLIDTANGDMLKVIYSDGEVFDSSRTSGPGPYGDIIINSTSVDILLHVAAGLSAPPSFHLNYRLTNCVHYIDLLDKLCSSDTLSENALNGEISTPGYPLLQYAPSTYCAWIFNGGSGSQTECWNSGIDQYLIEFEIVEMQIETNVLSQSESASPNIQCIDMLEIFDGTTAERKRIGDAVCGSRPTTIPTKSSTARATVSFISDRKSEAFSPETDFGSVRTSLSCCSYDCEYNYVCVNCPEDTGHFSMTYRMVKKSGVETSTTNFPQFTQSSCEDHWTRWFNTVKPTGVTVAGVTLSGGEFETMYNIRNSYDSAYGGTGALCAEDQTLAIECRTQNGVGWKNSGQVALECDVSHGFLCYNRPQPDKCFDYEVRFFCICNTTSVYKSVNEDMGILSLESSGQWTNSGEESRMKEKSGECTPGWTTWIELITISSEFNSYSEQILLSSFYSKLLANGSICENPIVISCRKTSNLKLITDLQAQDGFGAGTHNFDPVYTCDSELGVKCSQIVPCHPCESIQFRMYCPCSLNEERVSTVTNTIITAKPYEYKEPLMCYACKDSSSNECARANKMEMTKINCTEGGCWSTSIFTQQGLVETHRGCDSSRCSKKYMKGGCYYKDSQRKMVICTQCCDTDLCNTHFFENNLDFMGNCATTVFSKTIFVYLMLLLAYEYSF